MKCPKCEKDHQAKLGMVCSCSYRFTFNPKSRETFGFTDGKFLAAYRKASQNETAHFTLTQLYAAYCANIKNSAVPLYIVSAVAFLISIFFVWTEVVVGAFGLGIAVLTFGAALYSKAFVIPWQQFQVHASRWYAEGKETPGVLVEPSLHQPPPNWSEEDIYSYGVERILIVNRDILVDLLVFNNVHAEQRMLVLSESGYPSYLQSVARKLLDERADLPVFLLHDATRDCQNMERRLREQSWLGIRQHKVIDLGLKPSDFEKIKRTKNFDNQRPIRDLPVDALQTLFLAEGMLLCFASESSFESMLMRQAADSGSGGSDFG
ncbi:MAG: hypothetical protein AAF483_29535 [Planctomycetota bacterium]